jgi:hypothetical protein
MGVFPRSTPVVKGEVESLLPELTIGSCRRFLLAWAMLSALFTWVAVAGT